MIGSSALLVIGPCWDFVEWCSVHTVEEPLYHHVQTAMVSFELVWCTKIKQNSSVQLDVWLIFPFFLQDMFVWASY